MFACFFETNVPNIPFLKPKLFSFLFFFVCFRFCFHGVCFCLSVSMLVLFLSIILPCFLSCFSFCFQFMKKTLFSLQFWCFLQLSWLKGNSFFMFNVFVLVLVLSVCNLNNEVALFCVCVVCFLFLVNKTKWFPGLHLAVLFLSWLFCVFFISFKKKTKKSDTAKKTKPKMLRKKEQTKHSVSAAVFTNSVPNFGGVGYTMWFCWKHYKNRGFEHIFRKEKRQQINKIIEPKICPRLSLKSVQACCATQLDRFSAQQNVFFSDFLPFSYQNRIPPAERQKLLNKKKQYIYIYTYLFIDTYYFCLFWKRGVHQQKSR